MASLEGENQIAYNRQVLHDLHEGLESQPALKPAIPVVHMLREAHDPDGVQLEVAYLKYLIGSLIIERDIKSKATVTSFAAEYKTDLEKLEVYLREKGKLPPLKEEV